MTEPTVVQHDCLVTFCVCVCVCAAEQMFWEVMQLRREMSLAKLGYFKDEL